MNCDDMRRLLDGYLDGELDPIRNLEIEDHVQECASCAQLLKSRQALSSAVSGSTLYYKAPERLRKQLQTSLRKAGKGPADRPLMIWRLAGIAAVLAVMVLVAWSLVRMLAFASPNDGLIEEVVASHVRSLQAQHLVDIVSSDHHTVKPWFDGKLDFSPPVVDLASQGFPLAGGRLDYLNNRPVAAVVYRHDKHVINVFIWPSNHTVTADPQTVNRQGFYVSFWEKGGMSYWVISDMNEQEQAQFIKLLRSQT